MYTYSYINSLHKNGSERLKKKEKLFCYFVFLCLNFSSFQTKSYFRVEVRAILQAGHKIQLAGKDFKIYSKYIFLNYPKINILETTMDYSLGIIHD